MLALVGATLILGACGSQEPEPNFAKVYEYADECSTRRMNDLTSRVAAQDVTDEQLQQIVNDCLTEARETVGS